jgi:hypothetical protein
MGAQERPRPDRLGGKDRASRLNPAGALRAALIPSIWSSQQYRSYCSRMADDLSQRYHHLLTGVYDCVDRIVLNAYFSMGQAGGGFRVWWRSCTTAAKRSWTMHI